MKQRRAGKKYDMYDYIGKGKTFYDVLESYLHLNAHGNIDYSTENLMKRFRTYCQENDSSKATLEIHNNHYLKLFNKIVANLEYAVNPVNEPNDEVSHIMSLDEKGELLRALQDAGEKEDMNFYTVEEYINAIKENPLALTEPYYHRNTITEKVIDSALSVLSDENKLALRISLFREIYLPYITNEMQRKQTNPVYEHDEAWEEVNFISNVIYRPDALREYDDFLKEHYDNVSKQAEIDAIARSCEKKRERYVAESLREGLTNEEIYKAEKNGLGSVIFGSKDNQPLQQDSFTWRLNEYSEPKVILDGLAQYSENGQENERVVAISYGKFGYDTIFDENHRPTMSSDVMELVGITRLGKDGNKNYFVLVPFQTATIKKESELTEEDRKLLLYTNGVVPTIKDKLTGETMHIVEKERIPVALRDFYLKTAFSNEYLTAVVLDNYRYFGSISKNEKGKPRLSAKYSENAYDLEASKYALMYPGKVGNRTYYSLDSLINSTDFFAKHLGFVRSITNGEYEKITDGQSNENPTKDDGEPR